MAATYSINVGTPTEAYTSTQITDVLNLLPDNTQKLITPIDVRNAVFSNWESSVIRYTYSDDSTEYIGISRPNVKGDSIFLGKKTLYGSSVMDSSILSGSDIIFYNTKLDTNPSQNLTISFLAGTNTSLFPYAPNISVVEITGATPSLDFNISHNQPFGGDFNFIAGYEGRINLNGLILPSVNEISTMVLTPTASSGADLFLVRTSGGYLELKNGSYITSTIGTPGNVTNIYGSPVNLNGYPLEFTNLNPTPVSFGGITAGSTFSNVPLVEMIQMMLYPYSGPLSSVSITPSIRERVHAFAGTSSYYGYSLTKRTDDITSSNISIDGNSVLYNSPGPIISAGGYVTNTYSDVFTFSGSNIQSNLSGVFTFSVWATDGVSSYTASDSLNFVYPYFYGFSATTSNTQNIINGLSKIVDIEEDQIVSLAGSGYLYYCYPNSYGYLSNIVDGNGFTVWTYGTSSTSWTYSIVAGINSPSGYWSGNSYKVFRTTNSINITLPSQNYKFNF